MGDVVSGGDAAALRALLIENRRRDHPISAYLFDPDAMTDAILASDWLAAHVQAAAATAVEEALTEVERRLLAVSSDASYGYPEEVTDTYLDALRIVREVAAIEGGES